MTCREFAEFLLEYVEGDLDAEVRRRFDAHMAICPDCVRYLQQYTDTITAGRLSMADDAPADIPEALIAAILEARRR